MQLEAELTRVKSVNNQLETGIQEMTKQSLTNAQTSATEIRALQEEKHSVHTAHQLEISLLKKDLNQLTNENSEYKKEITRLQNKITELKELETQINSVSLLKSEQKMIQSSFEEKFKQLDTIHNQKQREVEILSLDLNQAKEQLTHNRKSLELLQNELASSRTMLIKAREEIVKRSRNEEQLEKSLQRLRVEVEQTNVHKSAAEMASKTAVANSQELETQLESCRNSNMAIQARLHEVEKELSETKLIKLQLEERLSKLTENLQIAQKQVEEKHAQLNHSDSVVNRMTKEFKRTQMTIEESARKVNSLFGQLKTTQEKLSRTNEHLNDAEISRKNLMRELEEYRNSHHTHDNEVHSMEVQINYLLSELGQMNERLTASQKELTNSQSEAESLKKQINETLLETKHINSLLNEKQKKLEHSEHQIIEMENQLNSADQYAHSLSSANEDLMSELKNRSNELEKLQMEVKQSMTGIQNSELMIQELEFSVQQLTKQLEQSEILRVEAEKASNQAAGESAAIKIELAKKEEKIISLKNSSDSITQKLRSLEQTSSQTEQIINKYIQSEIEKDNMIQRLQTEMEHIRYQLNESETELQSRSSQIKVLTHELEATKTNLLELTLHRNSENLARKRTEMEITDLREMQLAFTEQIERQEQFIERLQSELTNEREKSDFLSKIKMDKEREVQSMTNEVEHLHHSNKELTSRLQERESALDAMSRELELFTSRLDTTSRNLTETEAELLETRQKLNYLRLELINKRMRSVYFLTCSVFKHYRNFTQTILVSILERTPHISFQLKQCEITLSSLESRLLERESQLTKCVGQCSQYESVDRVQCAQLTDLVKDLKQQITEHKKVNMISKTERAQLQETVNRLEGELAARSDALRKAAIDATRVQMEHELELNNKTSNLNESLYHMENKWKEACKMIEKLEKECKDQEFKLIEASTNSSDENKLLKQKLDSVQSKNRTLCNELETIKLSKETLQNEYTQVQDELNKLKKKIQSTAEKVSAAVQTVQKFANASTNTEKIEQDERIPLPKLQLSSSRPKSYSEQMKTFNLSPNEQEKLPDCDISSPENSADSIEIRVKALKQANRYLRMEVENACKMLNSSVGFFEEPDEYTEYGDESIVEQESKTVWLERVESISQKFHDNNNYWSNKLENIDKMKNPSRDTVQNTERQTNSSRTTTLNSDRKIKPSRLQDSSNGSNNGSGQVKLTKTESTDYHTKSGDRFSKLANTSKMNSIPFKQTTSYRSSRIK
ncbi:unnamed protein product [Heterobilharzia americana]|nr:unnamed protein product [Heterobilharzia americana]